MQKPRQPKPAAKKPAKPNKAAGAATGSERINRYLARCGLCSRREADRWVADGRIAVNGTKITEPGVQIGPKDIVTVDGKPVSRVERFTYILYHKPRGLLCARHDPKGRPLIFDKLDVGASVQNVGRLDMDTEGLLLLTDDGDMTRTLTNPRNELPREYRVRVAGQLALETLEKLRNGGLDIGKGEKSAPWEISVDSETGGHSWLTVVIKRGRWREVRRTLEAAGHPVRRLIRTRFGSLKLDPEMPAGSWIRLNSAEVKKLKASVSRL